MREKSYQCAQQIDLTDEVVVTHERRTIGVAGVGDLLTQPTFSQEAAWAAAGEAAWAAGTAAADHWEKFIDPETTDDWRNQHIKLIPRVVTGPWVVRKLVGR